MNLHRFLILLLLSDITIARGFAATLAESGTQPTMSLRAAAQVDGAGVFLEQVLADLPSGLTNCPIAPAPSPNQTVVFSRAQVQQALEKCFPDCALTNWTGAPTVRVSRKLRTFEEPELKALLTGTLQREQARDRGDLELRIMRPWTAVSVPDEPLSLRVLELPVAGLTPNFIVRFELRTDRETIGTWQVPLQAKLWREVWVAKSPQPRGRALSETDLTREKRDLLTLRDAWLSSDYPESALELAENLQMGMPLLQRSVRLRPIIRRGKQLEALVQEGPMTITVKVEALEDGVPGQLIRVRNTKSKREFAAKVQTEQTVLVGL